MALDCGEGTLLLLLDLSAAFDTVNHCILLKRLTQMGVTGYAHAWLSKYLSDRVQVIDTGSSRSNEFKLKTSVPQGSILGPVLFLCYVKPLGDVIDKHLHLRHGYADDTQLYCHFKLNDAASLKNAVNKLEGSVCDIRTWMVTNKLMLNDSKTELLVVIPKNSVLPFPPSVKVGEAVVKPSDTVRNLGAILDKHMCMSPQVNQVCRSVYHQLRTISKVRKHVTKEACAKVINALVTSRLDYNNGLLHGLPDSLLTRLQVAQNSAARLLEGIRRREHIQPVLKSLHWLPVRKRILYKILLVTYKVVHNLAPPQYLSSLLVPYSPARHLRSSQKALLKVPTVKRKVGERSYHFAAPSLWNNLDIALRSAKTVTSFKSDLKTFLFQ